MLKKILTSLSLLLLLSITNAQVKINEYSASNSGATILDNLGNNSDWVELYNTGAAVVNLGGWNLSNDPSNLSKFSFPSGVTIAPSGFLRIWCSGKGSTADAVGHIHTNFKLTQCKGDWIVLSNGGALKDSVQMRRTQATHSIGRTPDGALTWNIFTAPTPSATNSTTGYTSYAPMPVMSVASGFYSGTQNVALSVTPSNSITIRYTTDGSTPTAASPLYVSAPINTSSTTVIRAYAIHSNSVILPSFIQTNTYFINETINNQYGVVSVSSGTLLYNATTPSTSLLGGSNSLPLTHFEYFENNAFVTESFGISSVDANNASALEQRGIYFDSKDEYGYSNALKHKIFNNSTLGSSNRQEFEQVKLRAASSDNYPCKAYSTGTVSAFPSCHMRDALLQSYSFNKGFNVDGERVKPIIVFVNGAYHGIYELREAFGTDVTDFYYNEPKDSTDNLAYKGAIQIKDGSDTAWVNLYNFVMTKSMTNVADYAYVNNHIEFKSLMDYMIYNSYVVNTDFINNNTAWWRGRANNASQNKWRYSMLDMDNVYQLGENLSGIDTIGMNSEPCTYENVYMSAGGNLGHPDILRKLMTNPSFKAAYVNRYADLLNSDLKCSALLGHFNYYKGLLNPEMQRHINKWSPIAGGGSLAEWKSNVDTLEKRINERCSSIESKLKSCYNLAGPFDVTVDVDPPGAGTVKLNTLSLNNYIWSGRYFGGVTMTFEETVSDASLYEFDYWEFKNHVPSPNIYNDSVSINLTTSENVIAHYVEKNVDVLFPTAFSPNGDGINDVLFPLGNRFIKSISVQIWNRWGQMVYSTTDPNAGWDGNFQGTPSQTGVYAYYITYVKNNGEEKISKGNITLVR